MSQPLRALVANAWDARPPSGFLDVRSPYDGTPVATVAIPGPESVEDAVASAVAHMRARPQPAHARTALLLRIADAIQTREAELTELLVREAGKPLRAARREVARAAHTFRATAHELATWRGLAVDLGSSPVSADGRAWVGRVPRGPVLAVTPANSPLNLVAHKIAPAVAVSAPVVLKPHESAPVVALRLAELVVECGLESRGSLSVLPVDRMAAQCLVEEERFAVLSFTGSRVGWQLKAAVPRRHAILELGSSAAVIVDQTWPATNAACLVAEGAFDGSGLSCISTQRVLVHRSLFDDVLPALVAECRRFQPADPAEDTARIRPIAAAERRRILDAVGEAVRRGACVRAGGRADGAFVLPTVLTDVPLDCDVWREEIFGPVVCLRPYESLEEAIAVVNDAPGAIHAGLLTRDLTTAWTAYERLDVSGVVVGGHSDFRDDALPYGGTGDAGYGREGTRWAMEELTETRTLVFR